MNTITPRELMEKHGLQVFEDIRQLDGDRTNRTIITDDTLARKLGVKPGAIVAMPPGNPDCQYTSLQRAQKLTEAHPGKGARITRWVEGRPLGRNGARWLYRCEAPHWQAELRIQTDIFRIEDHQQAEPLYRFFDSLQVLMKPMLEAAQSTRRWPQTHRPEAQVLEVLEDPAETIGLHQRYG